MSGVVATVAAEMSVSRLSRVGPIGFGTLAMLLMSGCGKGGPQGQGAAGAGPRPTAVTAVAAVARNVPVYLDEIGKVTASESVTITPQVSGKIIARKFKDGAQIHKGELLFQIDPRPFQAQLDQAKGQLAKDQATKASAQWNVSQDQAAIANKAISQQQLHTDVAQRDSSIGAIAVDKAMIETAQLNLDYCSIRSPIDGRAGARLVDVGNVVNNSGQSAGSKLLVINRLNPIYADFTVTEAELQRVHRYMAEGTLVVYVQTPQDQAEALMHKPLVPSAGPGKVASSVKAAASTKIPTTQKSSMAMAGSTTQPASFEPRKGKLIFLDNSVQDGTGTIRLRAELPNADDHFWPGQFVNVRLVLTIRKNAVLVPAVATQVSQQGLFVYAVHAGKSEGSLVADQQMVTLGQRQGAMVVVDKGLQAGEKVVTAGQMMLQPGSPVMIIQPHGPGPMEPGKMPKPRQDVLKKTASKQASNTGSSDNGVSASADTGARS